LMLPEKKMVALASKLFDKRNGASSQRRSAVFPFPHARLSTG
jgi:hypothetical protein